MKKKNSKKPAKKSAAKSVKRVKKSARTHAIFRKDPSAKKAAAPVKKFSVAEKAKNMNDKANRLLLKGRERGFVTYDEILKEFPTVEDDIVFLDDLYQKFNTAGIDVLEGGGLLDVADEAMEKKLAKDSSYDSIQMYLKEIGQYPLLTGNEEKDSKQGTMMQRLCLCAPTCV